MKPLTMIPKTASSLRVVAFNKKSRTEQVHDDELLKENGNTDIKIARTDEDGVEKKKTPEFFEYRFKERKYDPL